MHMKIGKRAGSEVLYIQPFTEGHTCNIIGYISKFTKGYFVLGYISKNAFITVLFPYNITSFF